MYIVTAGFSVSQLILLLYNNVQHKLQPLYQRFEVDNYSDRFLDKVAIDSISMTNLSLVTFTTVLVLKKAFQCCFCILYIILWCGIKCRKKAARLSRFEVFVNFGGVRVV